MEHYYSGLYTDFYELTMAQAFFFSPKKDTSAIFDLYFRSNPFRGGYAVLAGIEDAVNGILQFYFDANDLDYLTSIGFRKEFLDYLATFRFSGNIHGFREGDIVFANDPLLRVESTILEAQLIESMLLNIVNYQTLIATKAMRAVYAAKGRDVVDFGLRRAQSMGAIAGARSAYIGGATGTSNTFAAKRYGIPAVGTHAHSWIQSFDTELEAFRKYAEMYPDHTTLLVDTYSTLKSGIPHAIQVAREMAEKGHHLEAIRLDSGDLAYFSKKARKLLDNAQLESVKIVASNQLDERLIASLLEQGAPIDIFGVGTRLVTGGEQSALDGIYKMSSIGGTPTIKLSENEEKINFPGKKKVVRYTNGDGYFAIDGVMLEDESEDRIRILRHPSTEFKKTRILQEVLSAEPVFFPLVEEGNLCATFPSLDEIRQFAKMRFALLSDGHKRFVNPHLYRVGLSNRLYELRRNLIEKGHRHG
ncbi:MAG: nicotinate phosphoribosyltransferase [Acidobacteria bacterium]|nr:MAG: nicotinate phosphoribosyltransferase [Acidobacteriota bacterium]RLE22229.1 MAG: nicotinate phosphoribosyltransferase [Acidobacteriota bacterium]